LEYQSYFLVEWPDKTLSQIKVNWNNKQYEKFDSFGTYDVATMGEYAATSTLTGFAIHGTRTSLLGHQFNGYTVGFVENLNSYRSTRVFSKSAVMNDMPLPNEETVTIQP
jgi:hypothetical protein